MTDKWIYALNSLAWALVGSLITLTYQKVTAWWHKRKGDNPKEPITGLAWIGMFIVGVSLASAAFSGSNQITASRNTNQLRAQNRAFQQQVVCQNAINQSNVLVQNERARRGDQDSQNLNTLLTAEQKALAAPGPSTLGEIDAAFDIYQSVKMMNDAFRAQNVLTPLSNCGPPVAPPKK